eukprot:COSAG02_NODE_5041_length_4701_cov_154.801391_1_plen_289_part_00
MAVTCRGDPCCCCCCCCCCWRLLESRLLTSSTSTAPMIRLMIRRRLLIPLLLLPPATANYCGPGACYWWSGTSDAGAQECGRTSDPNSRHSARGKSDCYRCLAGRYQPSSRWRYGGCTACRAGRYSSSTGATSSISCTFCGVGRYSSSTGATSASSCIACGAGRYSSSTGASSSSSCIACEAGWYSSSSTGASSCTDQCTAGRYSSDSSSSCIGCGVGRYSSSTGGTSVGSCIDCPEGTSIEEPTGPCTTCPYADRCFGGVCSVGSGGKGCAACLAGYFTSVSLNSQR